MKTSDPLSDLTVTIAPCTPFVVTLAQTWATPPESEPAIISTRPFIITPWASFRRLDG